jgi:ATP-dependent 26S proteasome regulatory subunit
MAEPALPAWASSLRARYLAGEASVFLLHGNTRDLQPWAEADGTLRHVSLQEFLVRFLARSRDIVARYDVSQGLEFPTKSQQGAFLRAVNSHRLLLGREEIRELPRTISQVLPVVEDLVTSPGSRAGVVLDYVETIVPNADMAFMGEAEKSNLVTMIRLGADPGLLASDNLVILVTETLAEVNRRLVASSHVAALEVPLPPIEERAAFLRAQDRREVRSELSEEQLAKVTAGLSLVQIRGLLRQARQSGESVTFATVNRRKKAIIEQECHGLVEFVDPSHDFSHVGGNEGIKAELMRVAEGIKTGHRNRVPMGVILVGPMGTGKTFVAEAFARESGLTCLKFKNFREKWVGSTEGNLEKILRVVDGLGYVLLIIDEADRSLSAGGDNDGGTSSRVIARLKEFMSDTSHRGRVVILMMTNRPDKLDTDLKRPGRFDLKVPFFFPETAPEREAVLAAVARKAGLGLDGGLSLAGAAERTAGYSAAELEAVMIAASNFAAWEGRPALTAADLDRAVTDVVPSRDTRMLEFMEMLAVFEASSRRMLPERYRELTTEVVQDRLDGLRARLGHRVA